VTAYEQVMAYVEVYSQVGTTATTLTASYTNDAGTAGRTSPAVTFGGTGFRAPPSLLPIPLAAGDRGVKSVETVTLAATTGTAGNFGITLLRFITIIPVVTRSVNTLWEGMLGGGCNLPDVTNVCMNVAYVFSTATGGDAMFEMRFIDA
jgi:hypothetical protein